MLPTGFPLRFKPAANAGVKWNHAVGLDKFYNFIKESYPEISAKADAEYDQYWNTIVTMEFSAYSWFKSLADALNKEMSKKVDPSIHKELFKEIDRGFGVGNDELKNAIDVSFVENLFWQVPERESEIYWAELSGNLRDLYLRFHRRLPF